MLVVLGFGVRRFGGVLKSSDIALIETSTPTDPSADFISAQIRKLIESLFCLLKLGLGEGSSSSHTG